MSQSEFIELVCSIRRIKDPAFFDMPLNALPLDSLDLLELRAALEVRLGIPLTNEKFVAASSLTDLYHLVSR